jgi:protein-disulfide isomerase
MKRILPFVIVGVVAALTIGSGMYLYRTKIAAAGPKPDMRGANTEIRGADSVHALGPANAPVTLEEFADFQCPPCGKLSEPINQLQREFASKLRFVFRNFPLAMHTHAREAARAAEAAGLQGKFWQMHDLLFREQEVWSKSDDVHSLFDAYARMIGLNLERFHKDMQGSEVEAQISIDQRHGSVIGVRNTPTLFLNNEALSTEVLEPAKLRAAVTAAINGKQPSS